MKGKADRKMELITGRLCTISKRNTKEEHQLYTQEENFDSEYIGAQKQTKEFMEFPTIEVFKNIRFLSIKYSLYAFLHRKLGDQIIYATSYDFISIFQWCKVFLT